MNVNLIKKVIDNLRGDKPNLDYVLGILDTVYEMEGENGKKSPGALVGGMSLGSTKSTATEAEIMDAKARAAIDVVKNMTHVEQN